MKNFTQMFYKLKINTFVEFVRPKSYADVNLIQPKEYSDIENYKLKFGY